MKKLTMLTIVGVLALTLVAVAGAHRIVTIKGTHGPDFLTGTPAADRIVARGGNDLVNAGDGRDRVHGNRGDDTLNGDAGNDRVWGGQGNDTIVGGEGDDVLRGRPGNDSIDGGPGNDVMWPGHGADVQQGGDGDDRLHALARDRQLDQIDCGPGHDVVWLNAKEQDTHVTGLVDTPVRGARAGGDTSTPPGLPTGGCGRWGCDASGRRRPSSPAALDVAPVIALRGSGRERDAPRALRAPDGALPARVVIGRMIQHRTSFHAIQATAAALP